jgi:hypothetical protein
MIIYSFKIDAMYYLIKIIKSPANKKFGPQNNNLYVSGRERPCTLKRAGYFTEEGANRWIKYFEIKNGPGYEFQLIDSEQKQKLGEISA